MSNIALELPLNIPASKPRMPAPPIVRSAQIEGPYRWTMTRAWGAGPVITWVLFNPSDADGRRDDPTTLRMMGFSYRWGFGSMVVANVYPFIASKPADLWTPYPKNPEFCTTSFAPSVLAIALVPCKGALGFFALPPEICRQVAESVRSLAISPTMCDGKNG